MDIVCSIRGLFLLSALSLCACLPQSQQSGLHLQKTFQPQHQLAQDFDWNLGKVVHKVEHNNMVLSTISVKLVIGMLYLGAAGKTAKEIEEILKVKPSEKSATFAKFSAALRSLEASQKEYELDIATKIFFDTTVYTKPEFIAKLGEYFNSSIQTLDFKQKNVALEAVNTWADKATRGKIQNLITEEDTHESTVMLLINAIYFKGLWEKPFAPEATVTNSFTLLDGTQIQVQYMTMVDKFNYTTIPELDCKLLRLPYMGKRFAMYIFLPNNQTGSRRVVEDMTPQLLEKSIKGLREETVLVRMPKFHFESTVILGPLLEELGLKEVFSASADLSNLGHSVQGNLAVSNVLQKAGLEVNEQGSTAYAATEGELITRIRDPISAEVSMKHPFVFTIIDEVTQVIVFVGKVMNPLFQGKPIVEIPVGPEAEDVYSLFSEGDIHGEKPDSSIESAHDERYHFFDTELLQKTKDLSSGNVVISPQSIKSTLAMLLEGAKGKTEQELRDVLRLPDNKNEARALIRKHQSMLKDKSPNITLEFQNKIFLALPEKLNPQYSAIAKSLYYSDVQNVNFANPFLAAGVINDWVKNTTRGLITSLVSADSLDASTKLFLANCIYFKGDWLTQFDEQQTVTDCFYYSNSNCQNSYLMRLKTELNYALVKTLSADVVEIPFKDPRYTMLVMLPTKKSAIGALLKDLQRHSIQHILSELKMTKVDLTLPRFTIEYSSSMVQALKASDVKEVFQPTADLSGMLDSKKPYAVSDIVHKAKIEVTEKGAEAAAATGAEVIMLSMTKDVQVRADHPFVFFIRDKSSGGVLFEGILTRPDPVKEILRIASEKVTRPLSSAEVASRYPEDDSPASYSQIFQLPKPSDKDGIHYPRFPPIRSGARG